MTERGSSNRRIRKAAKMYALWCQGKVTQAEAASNLGMGQRTFRRYVAFFKQRRLYNHRTKPRSSPKRAPRDEVKALTALYCERYTTWSIRRFYDAYRNWHGGMRSYTWVKNILQTAELASKGESRKSVERERHSRSLREGVLLYQGSRQLKSGDGDRWELTLVFDGATSRVYSGFVVTRTDVWSAFRGIWQTVATNGLFDGVCTEQEWPYRVNADHVAVDNSARVQFVGAMDSLGIEVVGTTPVAIQNRAERVFGVLQEQLPAELGRLRITGVAGANAFLEDYWSRFNLLMAAKPREYDRFVQLTPSLLREVRDSLCPMEDS